LQSTGPRHTPTAGFFGRAAKAVECTKTPCERENDCHSEYDPAPRDERGRQLIHSHLDEEVGQSPDE
jgi:hypothetical protein